MTRILDLDLDFFVSPTPVGNDTPAGRRADSRRFTTATPEEVRRFLEDGLGLSTARRIPARSGVTHDGAFWAWRTLIADGTLTPPFDVVHVDNHADLGMGDAGWHFIATELLHWPAAERVNPPAERVLEGNYLAFAAAAGWLGRVTYVAPECRFDEGRYRREDRMPFYFQDRDPDRGDFALPIHARGADANSRPLHRGPSLPFTTIPASEYHTRDPFDFGFLARSPRYTPPSADALVPVIAEYLDIGDF